MATMNLSLPDAMQAWVEAQARGGQYHDAGEYVRDLIRRDQTEREKLERLQAAIADGRASGVSSRSADEILAAAKSDLKNGR